MGDRVPTSYLDRARVYRGQAERYLIDGDEAMAALCASYARRCEHLARTRRTGGAAFG